jgi:hypothetical protein
MAENEKKKKGFLSGLVKKADKKIEEKEEEDCGCCSCCAPKKDEKGKGKSCCG